MYFCRVCNKKSPISPCVNCGAALTEANEIVNCPSCGKMFFKPKHNIKCTKCGADIIVESNNEQQPVNSNANLSGIVPPVPNFAQANNETQSVGVGVTPPVNQENLNTTQGNSSIPSNNVAQDSLGLNANVNTESSIVGQEQQNTDINTALNQSVNQDVNASTNSQNTEQNATNQNNDVDFLSLFNSVDENEIKSDDENGINNVEEKTAEPLNLQGNSEQVVNNNSRDTGEVDFGALHAESNESETSGNNPSVDENGFEIVYGDNSSSSNKKDEKKKKKKSKDKEEPIFGANGKEVIVKKGKGWKIFALIQTVIVLVCLVGIFFLTLYPMMTDPYQRAFNDYMDGKNYYQGIYADTTDETSYSVHIASSEEQCVKNNSVKYAVIKAEKYSKFLVVEVTTKFSLGPITFTTSKVVSREYDSLAEASIAMQEKLSQ